MEEKTTLGKFIMRKRKERGLTQRELADRLYVTESAVSKWERGVSYPDISLVSSLCGVLEITEHELVTASEDFRQRRIEKQARTYRRFTAGYVAAALIVYGAALITCLICNLAIQHTLSWFWIVFAGELTAFTLTTLPLLVPKHRGMVTLAAFFLSLQILLLICCLYTGGDWFTVAFLSVLLAFSIVFLPFLLRSAPLPSLWDRQKTLLCFAADTLLLFALLLAALAYAGRITQFLPVACPVALAALSLPWALMAIIRYVRVNALLRTSLCLTAAAVYAFTINGVLHLLIDRTPFSLPLFNLADWSDRYIEGNILWVTAMFLLLMAVIFAAGGVALAVRCQRKASAHH